MTKQTDDVIFECRLDDPEMQCVIKMFNEAFMRAEPFLVKGLMWNLTSVLRFTNTDPRSALFGVTTFTVRGTQVPVSGLFESQAFKSAAATVRASHGVKDEPRR